MKLEVHLKLCGLMGIVTDSGTVLKAPQTKRPTGSVSHISQRKWTCIILYQALPNKESRIGPIIVIRVDAQRRAVFNDWNKVLGMLQRKDGQMERRDKWDD